MYTENIVSGQYPYQICLGKQNEKNVRSFIFDCNALENEFPNGNPELVILRPFESVPYFAMLENKGENKYEWTVNNYDTNRDGYGEAELRWYSGNALCKSIKIQTVIKESISVDAVTPPDPFISWVDKVLEASAKAKQYADEAKESEVKSSQYNEATKENADRAEVYAEEAKQFGISAKGAKRDYIPVADGEGNWSWKSQSAASGFVKTVNDKQPDEDANITLNAHDVGAYTRTETDDKIHVLNQYVVNEFAQVDTQLENKESEENKAETITGENVDATHYPSTKAITDWVNERLPSAEEKANWNAKAEISDIEEAEATLHGEIQAVENKIPTNVSQLNNDSGYATTNDIPKNISDLTSDAQHQTVTQTEKDNWNNKSDFNGDYNSLTNKPTIPTSLAQLYDDETHRTVTDAEKIKWNSTVGFSGDYNDLTNKPFIPAKLSDMTQSEGYRTVSDTEKNTWNNKSDFDGSYNSLTDKPSIPERYDDTEIKQQISDVADSIPTSLSQLTGDSTHRVVSDTEKASWNAKSTFSGSYADLSDKPVIPTALSQLSSDQTHRTVTDAQIESWDSKSGGEVVEIGSYQYSYQGKVLPAIHSDILRTIYINDKAGIPQVLHWTLYGTENNLKVVSSDSIGGNNSIDVLVHNQYHCEYLWNAQTTGIVNPNIMSTEIPDATETVKGVVRLATESETKTGTNGTKAVTPKNLKTITDVIDDKIEKLQSAQIPNAVFVGDPSLVGSTVSGFTSTDYLIFPFVVDVRNKPFEIVFQFRTGNNVTTQQNILDSAFGIALAIKNGKGLIALSSDGTSFNIGQAVGTYTIQTNSVYYAKVSWDGSAYKTSISTDGKTYIDDMTLSSTAGLFPTTIYIGGSPDLFGVGTSHPFGGGVDMGESHLIIDGVQVWHGMDNAGLASRANVSLSNLDAVGEARFSEIKSEIFSKQDEIQDLDQIRSGAQKGATALQSVPTTYRTANAQDAIDNEIRASVSGVETALFEKITAPSSPAVGKILKVLSVSGDGTFTCEWADAPVAGVTDVKVSGSSIVSSGVANIPVKSTTAECLVKPYATTFYFSSVDGSLRVTKPTDSTILSRSEYRVVTCSSIDDIVKAAMCDGVGSAWTTAQQKAAQERIGIYSIEGVTF